MGRGFGGEWIHVYIWLSPFTVLQVSSFVSFLFRSYYIRDAHQLHFPPTHGNKVGIQMLTLSHLAVKPQWLWQIILE